MKGVNANGIRSKQVFLTLVTLICTTLLIWAWERTPLIATLLPQGGLLKVSPGNVSSGYPQAFEEDHLSNAEAGLEIPSDSDETGAVSPMSSVIAVNQSHVKQKKCNFGKGRWIPDAKRPLYSGYECKQWLSEMWACRIMERTDFSFEGFRWQSENCDMPDFTGTAFLERMKNRVLAFVGDSLGRQQFQSLMCMITGGKISLEVKDVGKDYGLVKAPGTIRPDGWAYWFPSTNTTVLYYWSASLCELNPLNPSDRKSNVSMNLDRPPHFLQKYLHRFDVLVLNTGHHWNRGKLDANRWVMYAGGEPVTDKNLLLIPNAKNFTVYSIVKWVDSQLPKHPHLKAFFRTISPRHFAGGDWNTGGSCDNMVPFARGAEVTQDGSSDSSVDGAVRGTRVKILDITALSQLRDEGHISKFSVKAAPGMQDCLHWCLPGIPDAWNEILFAQI